MDHEVLPGRDGSLTRSPDGSGARIFDVELTRLLSQDAPPPRPPRRLVMPHLPHRARVAVSTVLVIAVALAGQLTSRKLAASTPASDRVRNPVGAATAQNVTPAEAPPTSPSSADRDQAYGSGFGPAAIDEMPASVRPEAGLALPPVTANAPFRRDGASAEPVGVAGHVEPVFPPNPTDARVALPSDPPIAAAEGVSRVADAVDGLASPMPASTATEASRTLTRGSTIMTDAAASGPAALSISLHIQPDHLGSALPIVIEAEPPGPMASLSDPTIELQAPIRPSADTERALPTASSPAAGPAADQRETDLIISRARALMAGRDFRTARSLLELLVETSPEASLLLAQTFDGRHIKERRVRGVAADHPRARTLYQRAAQQGSYEAAQNLRDLKD